MKTVTKVFLFFIIFLNQSLYSQMDSQYKNIIGLIHTGDATINGLSFGAHLGIDDNNRKYVRTNGIRMELSTKGLLFGLFAPLVGINLITKDSINGKFTRNKYEFDEIINGINISTGSIGDIKYNGITLGFAQTGTLLNGIAIGGMTNQIIKSNGVQLAIYANYAIYNNGLQIGGYNGADYMNGLQIGFENYAKTTNGIQLGFSGNRSEKMTGVQISMYNTTSEFTGIQIGLFNTSKKTKGVQIGLWNVNEKRKLPILNWNFK